MKFVGGSLAAANFIGCVRQPDENIVPYVRTPEHVVPGEPLYFATAMTLGGWGTGVLAESHAGRPTKLEGNPQHPASLGATSAIEQAAVRDLYDVDRSQVVTHNGNISSYAAFHNALLQQVADLRTRDGRGLHVLAEASTSPTLKQQYQRLRENYPEMKWHLHDAVTTTNVGEGAQRAYGQDVRPVYDVSLPNVILSIDADFLSEGPGHLRYARQFSQRRNVLENNDRRDSFNRLYAVECTPTLTGAAADHRWPVRPGQVEPFLWGLLHELHVAGIPSPDLRPPLDPRWLRTIADDLRGSQRNRTSPNALVIAGERQPPLVHALTHVINDALGATGSAVRWIASPDAVARDESSNLADLVDHINRGEVDVLIILGGNPAFTAPHESGVADAIKRVPFSAHHSLYRDETSAVCQWHLPATHFLEAWDDIRAFDGTASIVQPVISPLYAGRTANELLALLLNDQQRSAREIVQATWRNLYSGEDFDTFWQRSLHDGVVANSAAPYVDVTLRKDLAKEVKPSKLAASHGDSGATDSPDLVFRLDPAIKDGRFANNGWLQELPKPFTKLSWGNAALMSPAHAKKLGIRNEDVVEISNSGETIQIPAWILPGQTEGVVTLTVGHGRTRAGTVGDNVGVNVNPLRSGPDLWSMPTASIRKTSGRQPLCCTQEHHLIDGRGLIQRGTVAEFAAQPHHPPFMELPHAGEGEAAWSFYPERTSDGPQWGMSINLSGCIGCNACVIACQAENNIPVVGPEEVQNGREMHWLRIDTYYDGPAENPSTFHQPVMCMHCEHAPCEVVCPVAATVHGDSGLNEMVYNRCVGTRYCSNNCPYKVRRFNYFDYQQELREQPVLQLLPNPDVTVRSRGVMEKCTYCVQRISAARITAEKEGRHIRDGEVVTACQAACPTQAIAFGDIGDSQSIVNGRKQSPLEYALLGELNTRPRTTYAAALKNPNPASANLNAPANLNES